MRWDESAKDGRGPRSLSAKGQTDYQRATPRRFLDHQPLAGTGVTLIELLCVIAIIAILASMLLPALSRAYNRVRSMAEEMEAPQIEHLLLKETRSYCAANLRYSFDSKSDFEEKCGLAPKCRDWVEASRTEFVPFNDLDPTNKIVLSVHIGRNHGTLYAFSKGELSTQPERH